MHTYIRICIHTHVHAGIHTCIHAYVHTHTYTHAYMHTCIHAYRGLVSNSFCGAQCEGTLGSPSFLIRCVIRNEMYLQTSRKADMGKGCFRMLPGGSGGWARGPRGWERDVSGGSGGWARGPGGWERGVFNRRQVVGRMGAWAGRMGKGRFQA